MPNPVNRNLLRSRILIFPLLALLLSLTACIDQGDLGTATIPAPGSTGPDGDTAPYTLYFSQPDQPESRSLRGGPDADLAEAIDGALLSVDVAAMELNLWSLRDALLAAQRRGVDVRMVTDSDYLDTPEIQQLVEGGIRVLGDRRESLMHHKFMVIDRQEVWTGSMNFTINGVYRNDNNLIRIHSTELAQDFTGEFEEMYVDDRFGDASRADTPFPRLEMGGYPLQVYFSPDDGVAGHLEDLVTSAQNSVEVLAYAFTLDSLADTLLQAAGRGVSVRGVFDAGQANENLGSDYQRLLQAGLALRLDGNPNKMHHKVLVIDHRWVVLGSYNFSASAEQNNDENVLILENPEIADRFLQEFERIYALASP
jgi:phosphatidylserine/phosphatidylglycerophosphate/cardiolipin synthase-like enzyme